MRIDDTGDASLSAEPFEQPVAPEPSAPAETSPWLRYLELPVALGVLILGVVILLETRDIRVPRAFTVVGPRDFPRVIGAALVLLGIWYAIDVIRNSPAAPSADSEDADASLPADWRVLGMLAAVLSIYALLMKPAGFVLASSWLFLGTAFALGSRQFLRDAALGIILSTLAYLLFSEYLGIRLPAGVLDGVF